MTDRPDDPVYLNSRREAIVTLIGWFVAGCYTLTYCLRNGYDLDPAEIEVVWGMPKWVVVGVFLPWTLANVYAWWFAFRLVKPDDLGADPDDAGSARTHDDAGSARTHDEAGSARGEGSHG